VPANNAQKGADGGTLRPVRWALGDVALLFAAAARFEKFNKNTRGRFLRRGFFNSCDDGVLPLICPTRQTISEPSKNLGKCAKTDSTN
jgi:hypothetical protein